MGLKLSGADRAVSYRANYRQFKQVPKMGQVSQGCSFWDVVCCLHPDCLGPGARWKLGRRAQKVSEGDWVEGTFTRHTGQGPEVRNLKPAWLGDGTETGAKIGDWRSGQKWEKMAWMTIMICRS